MKVKQKLNYRKSLRQYFSESVIKTVLISCFIAVAFVSLGIQIVIRQNLTPTMLGFVCLAICCLTIGLTGVILYFRTQKITLPIQRVSVAISEIASGDFATRVSDLKFKRGAYNFENELDELVTYVNLMASELEGMDYMRKDFMSNVSHEVKTPVAAITGFSEILRDGNLSREDQTEYLNLIHKESIRLSDLCENMLRLSKLDHQEIVISKSYFRLDEQIRKCLILLSDKWQDKAIDFVLDLPPITINSEKNMLMQVWMNLIDNAIKYSAESSQINISLKASDLKIDVCIEDQGIGIEKAKQSFIFDRFYQGEESHNRVGNGLGLSIVKRILELLEGSIVITSEPGQGTRALVSIKNRAEL